MAMISQRQANGLASMEQFRSKVAPIIADLKKEVDQHLSGAGPTRTRPSVNVCAIARRAGVARTTFRASYHSDIKDQIRDIKAKLQGRAKPGVKTPKVQKRKQRPKQQDLRDQLESTSQQLRESERRFHALKRQLKSHQDPTTLIGELDDRQIIELVTTALARRRS